MERIDLYRAWLLNEEKILGLLETLKPLLEARHKFEEEVPGLGLLRDSRTVPGEEPPKLSRGGETTPRKATLLQGSGVPLEGDPERGVPSMEEFNRLVLKRKALNKKKHEKAKLKKKNAPKSELQKDMEDEAQSSLMDEKDN